MIYDHDYVLHLSAVSSGIHKCRTAYRSGDSVGKLHTRQAVVKAKIAESRKPCPCLRLNHIISEILYL